MINVEQLREFVIKPVLIDLVVNSRELEELLVFTCAAESIGGSFIKQNNGTKLGIYQMNPDHYNYLWQNYIIKEGPLLLKFLYAFNAGHMPDEQRLIYDLRFATAMAVISYEKLRAITKEPLPSKEDVEAIWSFYEVYYKTGKMNKSEAIERYVLLLHGLHPGN